MRPSSTRRQGDAGFATFFIPNKDRADLRNLFLAQTSSIFSQRLSVLKASWLTRDRHPDWNGLYMQCVLTASTCSFFTAQGNAAAAAAAMKQGLLFLNVVAFSECKGIL